MLDLTFGEQVKIILSRKGMTIKELAETIEERTGKKMSRQNLTQRLGRDNFQEQDMRMIADILGCPFQLSILADSEAAERAANVEDVVPTEKELHKLAKTKARKEKKAREAEQLHAAMEQIPRDVVQDRFDRLVALQEQITEENLATFEGRDVEVMITGKLGKKDTDTHRVTGREKTGVLVHIGVPEGEPVPEIGDFVTATVTHAGRHNLLADPDVAAGQTYSVRH